MSFKNRVREARRLKRKAERDLENEKKLQEKQSLEKEKIARSEENRILKGYQEKLLQDKRYKRIINELNNRELHQALRMLWKNYRDVLLIQKFNPKVSYPKVTRDLGTEETSIKYALEKGGEIKVGYKYGYSSPETDDMFGGESDTYSTWTTTESQIVVKMYYSGMQLKYI